MNAEPVASTLLPCMKKNQNFTTPNTAATKRLPHRAQQRMLQRRAVAVATLALCAACGCTARLVVDRASGTLRESRDGRAFVARGVNFGTRLTPHPDRAANPTPPYNASDMAIAARLLPGLNLVRLVLDYYSDGGCATDIFDGGGSAATGFIRADWLSYIDTVVGWAAATAAAAPTGDTTAAVPAVPAVRVVLTLRNNNGTASPHGGHATTSGVPCAADYIGNATARGQWLATLAFLAARYRSNEAVAWIEPASEPHLLRVQPDPRAPGGKPWVPCHTPAQVTALFNAAIAAIREADPDVPVAAAPTGYEACPGLDLAADKLEDPNVIYAVNWPCNLGGGTDGIGGYGEIGTCGSLGKLKKGGTPTPPRACVPGCSLGEPDSAAFRYNRSTVEALAAPALAFRDAHHVPLWVDQLMCPPAAFRGATQWLADSAAVLGFLQRGGDDQNRTSFSWWTWKAPFGGNATQAVLWTPSAADRKDDPSLYQVYAPGYALFRQAFEGSL